MHINQKQITKKFNSNAKRYNFASIFMNFLLGRYRKKLVSNLNGEILETGIGNGANLKYYSKNSKIYGIDLSKEMLKIARKKANKLKLNVTFKIANSQKIPFKKGKFDYVVDTLGLCTYINPINSLKEMKRVSKITGKILFLEHGISNNNFIEKLQRKKEGKHHQHFHDSLTRNHEELIKKAGLKIEKVERKLFGIIYIIEARAY